MYEELSKQMISSTYEFLLLRTDIYDAKNSLLRFNDYNNTTPSHIFFANQMAICISNPQLTVIFQAFVIKNKKYSS